MTAKTQPDFYDRVLSEESSYLRADYEQQLEQLYADLDDLTGVKRLRQLQTINRLEQRLSWQGANPKVLPFKELREHVRYAHSDDGLENKYQARIGNRATAIRAYCVSCQGGSVVGVKECTTVICPLHPFRMGTDPLRGYELPKADPILIDDDETDDLFEEGDDAEEADAIE